MKRLLLIVFFSLMTAACASDNQTKDVYDQSPDTEITSQPMQINYPSGQTELSKSINELKGFWVPENGYGYVVYIDADGFLTFVDQVAETDDGKNIKLSYHSDSVKDFGRMMYFVSTDLDQNSKFVELMLGRSSNGEIVRFNLIFDNVQNSQTVFVRGNTSIEDEYRQTLLSSNRLTD